MDVAALNEKITIQQSTVSTDTIGNKSLTWATYFTCYATVSGEESTVSAENNEAGTVNYVPRIAFTVRWSSETAALDTVNYRISYNSKIYNIVGIDHKGYKKQCLKLQCEQESR